MLTYGHQCYYRIPDWLRWEGTSGLHLVQPPAHPELVAQDRVQRVVSISKDGDSTTSLGNLCRGWGTLPGKSVS